VYFNLKMTSNLKFNLKLKIDLKNNPENSKSHLKRPCMISHQLVVLIGHDSADL
jgi:hypothetical protein